MKLKSIKYKNMKKICYTFFCLIFCYSTCFGQGSWASLANFFEGRHSAISFALSGKLYAGLGQSQSTLKNDLWSYNPTTDAWTQRANFPGNSRIYASSVEFTNKGYVMGGYPASGQNNAFKDFWEYNPILNTWTQKVDLTGLTLGGVDGTAFSTSTAIYYLTSPKKLWKYDPTLDYWIPQSDYPGVAGQGYSSFVINGRPFIGLGTAPSISAELYEFLPSTNSWVQKANFPGQARAHAVGFSIGSFGYMGLGYAGSNIWLKDLYRYNPQDNTWISETNFPATEREQAIALVTNLKGYIGLGINPLTGTSFSDFWEFSPAIVSNAYESKNAVQFRVFPNPSKGIISVESNEEIRNYSTLKIADINGRIVKAFEIQAITQNQFDISMLENGVYTMILENLKQRINVSKVILSK